PPAKSGYSPFGGTFAIAEQVDDHTSRQAVVRTGIHVVAVEEIEAQRFVVPEERGAARARIGACYVLGNIMASMEHERGATVDAHIADAKKYRTGRFADALDPKGLAAGIVLADDGDGVRDVASFAATYRRSFCGGGRHICVPDNSEHNRYRSSKVTKEPDGA